MSVPWSSRSTHRLVHLLLAVALGTYLYSPLADVRLAELAVRFAVFPALVVSGLLMWQGARLRRG